MTTQTEGTPGPEEKPARASSKSNKPDNGASAGDSSTSGFPRAIELMLKDVPLTSNESHDDFLTMFYELGVVMEAETQSDFHLVYEVTILTMEVIRYRRLKIAVLNNARRPALHKLFKTTNNFAVPRDKEFAVDFEASSNIKKWTSDPAFRKKSAKDFEDAGYTADAVETEAFVQSLPQLAAIENLIASAQKRLNSFLKEADIRCEQRKAMKLRQAVNAATKKG